MAIFKALERIIEMKEKILKISAGLFLFLVVGAFLFLAMVNVSVTQSTITKTIANERFFQ